MQSSAAGVLPNPRDPGGSTWFTVETGGLVGCSPVPIPGLSMSDTLIINNDLFDGGWTQAQIWSAKEKLMLKLIRNSSLRPANSDAEDFYDDNINESFSEHAQVLSDYMDAMLDPEEHEQADSTYEVMLFWLDSLAYVQSSSRDIDTLPEDTAYIVDLTRLMDTLLTVMEADYGLRQDIRSAQNTSLDNVLNDIKQLPIDSTYEIYSKKLLEVIATSSKEDSISATHLLVLDTIASDSVKGGGTAVMVARMLLGPCSGYEIVGENAFVTPASPFVPAESLPEFYVNYSSEEDRLTIWWNEIVSGNVRVIDVAGREIYSGSIEDVKQFNIHLRLPAGVYFTSYLGLDGSPQTETFFVK